MTSLTPKAVAIGILKPYVERGDEQGRYVGARPPSDETPAIHYTTGGYLFPKKDGGDGIKLKRHEFGVIFYFADGHSEYEIYDLRQLWDDIKNPKPTQLELWPELSL